MIDMLSAEPGKSGPGFAADGYDIFGTAYRENPASTWRTVRPSHCPVARSDREGGFYLLARSDGISGTARDDEHVSSRAVAEAGGSFLPRLISDPPGREPYRNALTPFFMPERTAALEELIRAKARDRARAIAAAGTGDAVSGYAQHITLARRTGGAEQVNIGAESPEAAQ